VSVRLVKCNGLDLSLFQFDSDLTFAVFFFNADRTLYARYGTRSQHDADKDVSLEGLAATMRTVLALHAEYPGNATKLAKKQPVAVEQPTPESYPLLSQFKPELDYGGRVAGSCIHCHQIRDAQRMIVRQQNKTMPDPVVFPFPSPRTIGLSFDKQTRSTVQVEEDSSAGLAGLRNGDEIEQIDGQQVASEADFQWALNRLPDDNPVAVVINRAGKPVSLSMHLPEGWRRKGDISWRPTSWDLRRMVTGGMVLKPIPDSTRESMGLSADEMALVADHVGQFGAHARAKQAGLVKGDIVLEFDGRADFQSESELLAYGVQQKKPGDEAGIRYRRGNETHSTKIRIE